MNRLGFFVLLVILFIFRSWFTFDGTLSSGDWPYLFTENIREFSFLPEIRFLWLAPYYQIPTKILVEFFHIPWEFVERFLWFYPFVILSLWSSYLLTKSWIGSLIYSTNTYILMIVGGGQMGVAISYSIAPFLLASAIKLIDDDSLDQKIKNQKSKIKNILENLKLPLLVGLALAIHTMFDPRIAYITMTAVFVYFLWNMGQFVSKENISDALKTTARIFLIPLGLTFAVNNFWIIPLLSGKLPAEYRGLQSIEGFDFFSFADFPHAFSLLHPNWPENIFGKVYFLQPEFLLLPILAFVSLLFVGVLPRKNAEQDAEKRRIFFFAFIGLIGAFLAKGANEPFAEVNRFLFTYVPGMTLFRDSSKFYVLIALSYSFLIPFSLAEAVKSVSRIKYKVLSIHLSEKKLSFILSIVFLGYWIFLIHPAILGELRGTFRTRDVPEEYVRFKEFIKKQESAKIFWIPQKQRFGFSDKAHPAIQGSEYYSGASSSAIVKKLQEAILTEETMLLDLDVSYIVIPFDPEQELFMEDRKYSEKLRKKVIAALDTIPSLEKITEFEPITVYRLKRTFASDRHKMVELKPRITHD